MPRTAKPKPQSDPQQRSDADGMVYRTFPVRASTLDTEGRTVEAFIATENPVTEFDFDRWEWIPRVLLASGSEFNKQVPLLDSHQRFSLANQLGSIRSIRRKKSGEPRGVVGRLHFSESVDSEWRKVQEGHVTDVSAGFRIEKEIHVPEGQTATIEGQEFTGPVNVATKWRLLEGSLTPIGADELAKLRGLDPRQLVPRQREEKDFQMDEALKQLLVGRGMPDDLNDADAQKWLIDNAGTLFADAEPPADPGQGRSGVDGDRDELVRLLLSGLKERTDQPPANLPKTEPAALTADSVRELIVTALKEHEADRDKRQTQHRSEVDALVELVYGDDAPDGLTRELYAMQSLADVRDALKERRANEQSGVTVPLGARIQTGAAQRDKHTGALRDAFLVRALTSAGCHGDRLEQRHPISKRSAGWEQFQNISLLELARECLLADGYNPRGLSNEQIAKAALGWPEKVGLRSAEYAYHTTGSLAQITADAVNKTLLAGYEEAPRTWRGPMRQATSVSDFKTIHRIKLGAVPNLPAWPDNTNPQVAAVSDEEETYAVEARAEEISFSWRLLVNDDMDALSRVPALMGDAASRTVNSVAWAQITSNPTLSDGQALFLETATGNRKRSNLTTGAATPTVATLQTMSNKMRQMRGLNTPEGNESEDILNLTPTYLVGPGALETTILQLVNSIADPAASGNSGIFNPARTLTPLIEPLLDANSTTAWYLFASPSRVDTVEVTFLQGHEQPVTNDFVDPRTMSRVFIIVQTFAAKAIDHRGVQRHDGV